MTQDDANADLTLTEKIAIMAMADEDEYHFEEATHVHNQHGDNNYCCAGTRECFHPPASKAICNSVDLEPIVGD